METDVEFSELVDRGQVNVLFIITNKRMKAGKRNFPDSQTKWHTGANEEIDDLMDLRSTPSIYVIDEEGKIAAKISPSPRRCQSSRQKSRRKRKFDNI